jgi:hypothetical protein
MGSNSPISQQLITILNLEYQQTIRYVTSVPLIFTWHGKTSCHTMGKCSRVMCKFQVYLLEADITTQIGQDSLTRLSCLHKVRVSLVSVCVL